MQKIRKRCLQKRPHANIYFIVHSTNEARIKKDKLYTPNKLYSKKLMLDEHFLHECRH